MSSMSSPPPTPSSALPRLNANSSAFVPSVSAAKKVTLKNVDGTEVNIETLKIVPPPLTSTTATARQNLPVTPTRKTGTVRIETPEQRQKRLEEEEQKEKSKAEAEEKARKEEEKKKRDEEERKKKEEEQERIRKEDEEKERLRKEEKERMRKEEEERERSRKEEEEKERLRKVEEEKERLRQEEEEKERLRKEEEEKERVRKEQEEKRKEEEERQRREEEEKKRKEEEERIRIEEEKTREEEERRKREEEERRQQEEEDAAKAAEDEAEPELEVEGIKTTDSPVTPEPEEGELSSKDDAKEKSLRIDTTLSAKRRPGPLDLTHSHSRQPSSPLTLARPLDDLGSVTYPAGISSPNPELNAGAKEGKFRYVDRKSCVAVVNSHSSQIRSRLLVAVHVPLQGKTRVAPSFGCDRLGTSRSTLVDPRRFWS